MFIKQKNALNVFQAKFILVLNDPSFHLALLMNLKNHTRQRRYYLKSLYFDKVEDKTKVMRTPPFEIHHMSMHEWCILVDSWSTPQKQVMSLFTQPCYFFSSILWIVANMFILYVCVSSLFESHQKQTTRLVPLCHRFL